MKDYLIQVYVEIRANALNRPFSYLFHGENIIQKGTRVTVDFNNRERVAYVISVEEIEDIKLFKKQNPNLKLKHITNIIDREPLFSEELFNLALQVADYYFSPLIQVLQSMLPPSLRPLSSFLKAPKIAMEKFLIISSVVPTNLTTKQQTIYDQIKTSGEVLKSFISSPSIIRILIERGFVLEIEKEKNRYQIKKDFLKIDFKENKLTSEQSKVYDEVLSSEQETFLLQGVTGSGKTEVYLRLAEHYLNQGQGVLLIVSEINLTPMMISLCEQRFENQVAVLHSALTPAQKYDEYRKIKNGDAKIVVGARSAIFAPINNLGLIVIDEEHTSSYHQDTPPFYDVREIAAMRQNSNPDLKMVLGSATPSLITRAKAEKKVYGHLVLKNRINNMELPEVEIINLQDPSNLIDNSLIISKQLKNAIDQTIAKNEQVMLLLNRRGFASFLECERCHSVVRCPECNSSLTYHKEENNLKCHRCDLTFPYPKYCLECGHHSFYHFGFGTEAVHEEIKKMYPNNTIARLDTDVVKDRSSVNILNDFQDHKIDILIGTQMISKGHDFENVTLSAVIMADVGLKIPNYMASENAFSLIYQTIGRAGRGHKKGKAIIQTFNPTHYAIQLAAKQDYEAFFKQEMIIRKLSKFPPYWNLVLIHIYAQNGVDINQVSGELREILEKNIENFIADTSIVGPYKPYISRYGPYYKRLILLRTKNLSFLNDSLKKISDAASLDRNIKIEIEVNPINIF